MSDIASRTLYFPHIPMLSIYIAIEIKTAIWYHPFLWSTVRRVQDKRVSKSLSQIYSTSKSVKLWLSVYGGLLLALVPKFDLFRSISIFLDFAGVMWHELFRRCPVGKFGRRCIGGWSPASGSASTGASAAPHMAKPMVAAGSALTGGNPSWQPVSKFSLKLFSFKNLFLATGL